MLPVVVILDVVLIALITLPLKLNCPVLTLAPVILPDTETNCLLAIVCTVPPESL